MQIAGTSESRPRPRWLRDLQRDALGYSFAGPAVILLVIFSIVAIVVSLWISFHEWTFLRDERPWVGLDNYAKALDDPVFAKAFRNTARYAAIVVPAITGLGLLLALIGNEARQGRAVFRTIFFIPTLTPLVVLSFLWIWLFEPTGSFNIVLEKLGLPTPNWLMDPVMAPFAIIIMSVWAHVGYYMVIFMAGLADIPQIYYDASEVDGANIFQRFWHITLPLLRNTLIFVVVILAIGAFQVFDQVYLMTRGGPDNATEVMQALIYKQGFEFFHMGYASAMAWYLFAAIAFFTAIQMRIFRSQQLY